MSYQKHSKKDEFPEFKWKEYKELEGLHAPLSPSKAKTWRNYDEERLVKNYISSWAPEVGTIVHEFAEKCINYRIKLNSRNASLLTFWMADHNIPYNVYDFDLLYSNLINYVNDGIGFRMRTEQHLVHSLECHGTADAISFYDNTLRIHDLKTGVTPVHMEQLETYAALFCLDYGYNPTDINYILRIYQCGEVIEYIPNPIDILECSKDIVNKCNLLNSFKES